MKRPPPARHPAGSVASEAPPRRAPIGRILLTAFLIALIVAAAGLLLLWLRVSAFNGAVSSAPATSSALFGPLGGRDRVNVLLVGYGGDEQPGGTHLADSINIYSIDPVSDTTSVIPVPRDLWIEGVAGVPGNGKINEAFAAGWDESGVDGAGANLARVVSEVTGLEVGHWLAIDFRGFREMVDAVGGVTIDNPRAFSYTMNEQKFHSGNFDGGTFPVGSQQLDGAEALAYARARYTDVVAESSDFARSVRQQRILAALRVKVGGIGPGSLVPGLRLMDAMEGRLRSDLSAIDLALLAGHLQADRRIELSEDVILQATRNSVGQYILVVIGRSAPDDYAPLRGWIAEQLAMPVDASPSPSAGG